jgi:hypothetical protein
MRRAQELYFHDLPKDLVWVKLLPQPKPKIEEIALFRACLMVDRVGFASRTGGGDTRDILVF